MMWKLKSWSAWEGRSGSSRNPTGTGRSCYQSSLHLGNASIQRVPVVGQTCAISRNCVRVSFVSRAPLTLSLHLRRPQTQVTGCSMCCPHPQIIPGWAVKSRSRVGKDLCSWTTNYRALKKMTLIWKPLPCQLCAHGAATTNRAANNGDCGDHGTQMQQLCRLALTKG